MRTKHFLLAAIALVVLALAPAATQADPLVFSLNNATQTGMVGQTLTFNATVSNLGTFGDGVTINGDAASFPAPPSATLTLDDTLYFANFDGRTLANGTSFTGDLFTVSIGTGTAPGIYNGSFTLFYDGVLAGQRVTQNFRVIVQGAPSAVPEPTAMLLLGTGLAGIGTKLRKRRRARNDS